MSPIGDLSPQGSIALGILVGIASTSIQSIGLTLQRKSHLLEDEKDPGEYRRPPFRRRRWQLGMLMFIVSNLAGSSIQITTLPLPVLSTLQASGLVFNSVCATLILGEPFTRWSLGGTILVFAGAVLIAIFGAIGEPAHDLDQLLALMGRREFIAWFTCTLVLALAVIAGAKSSKYLGPRVRHSPRMRLLRGMSYGGVSGILSAHSLLLAKSAVELLVRTIVDKQNQFTRWQSWMILLGLVVLALTQLYYLHRGLKLCSTSILYPFVFCVYNIIAILDGLIYFDQTDRLTVLHAGLIAVGTVILLGGVLALSWRLNPDSSMRPSLPPQTPLTPGFGMVDEEATDIASESSKSISEATPLLDKESAEVRGLPPTPTLNTGNVLQVGRIRPRAKTEQQEIWDELENDTLPPISPFTPRRFSMRSASNPSSKRNSRFDLPDVHDDEAQVPSESTALLGREDTGRTYRDYKRRRSTIGSEARKRRSVSSQETMPEWLKMRWWKRRRKGKNQDSESGPERRSGESDRRDSM